jgi:ABC-type glycerol-3-phosphate transport system substrate-binding protein
MAVIDLKKEHTLYDESKEVDGGINYQGHGASFLKKDLNEKLQYCDDLDRDEADALFNNYEEYYFGDTSLNWEFTSKPPMGKGKVAMWFAKYWKNGYYEEPFE